MIVRTPRVITHQKSITWPRQAARLAGGISNLYNGTFKGSDRSVIFFCHVERTAGTAVHSSFARLFGGPAIVRSGGFEAGRPFFVVSRHDELAAVGEIARELPDRHFYLGGHVGLHHLPIAGIEIQDSDLVFTVVRDPVERSVSLYFLVRRSAGWFAEAQNEAAARGFEYFYSFHRDSGIYFRNDHCRLIGNANTYEAAAAILERHFALAGTCGAIPLFEQAIQRHLGEGKGFRFALGRENAAWHERTEDGGWRKKSSIGAIVPEPLRARIMSDNEEDAQLVDLIERQHGGLFSRFPTA
jgi:hypothetical protein